MKWNRFFFFLEVTLLTLFIFIGTFFWTLHSSWGSQKMISLLSSTLKKSNWKIEVKESSGFFLTQMNLSEIILSSKVGDRITIDEMHFQLSTSRLLLGEIAFSSLSAKGVRYDLSSHSPLPDTGAPLSIRVDQMELSRLYIPELEKNVDIAGSIKIGRYGHKIEAKLSTHLSDDATTIFDFNIFVSSNLQAEMNVTVRSQSFSQWKLPIQGKGLVVMNLHGSWDAFLGVFNENLAPAPLRGNLMAEIDVDNSESINSFAKGKWRLNSNIARSKDGLFHLRKIKLQQESEKVAGELTFHRNGRLDRGTLHLQGIDLSKLSNDRLTGTVSADVQILSADQMKIAISASAIDFMDQKIENGEFVIDGNRQHSIWNGSISTSLKMFEENWQGKSQFLWKPNESLLLNEIQLASGFSQLSGHVDVIQNVGELQLTTDQIHSFDLPFYAQVESKIRLREDDIEVEAKASSFYWNSFQSESADFFLRISKPFANSSGEILVATHNGRFHDFDSIEIRLESENQNGNWPLTLHANGNGKDAFALNFIGSGKKEDSVVAVEITQGSGQWVNEAISLLQPAAMRFSKNLFMLSDFSMSVGNANILGSVYYDLSKTKMNWDLKDFPLHLLSFNPLNLTLQGTIDIKGDILEESNITTGSIEAHIPDLSITQVGEAEPLFASANLFANLSTERFVGNMDLAVRENPLFQVELDLPISIALFPFQLQASLDKRANASLEFNGKIEELLDFFDIEWGRLSGACACNLKLQNTLGSPSLTGSIQLENARFENYVSGFVLQDINFKAYGGENRILIDSFSAKDNQNKGNVALTGELIADWNKRLPYSIQATLSRLNLSDLDWLQFEADGTLKMTGNVDAAHISGSIKMIESDLTIPEKIPNPISNIVVKYIHSPFPLTPTEPQAMSTFYPVFLDVQVDAIDGFFVSGRGLSSEWGGAFTIQGTLQEMQIFGNLTLRNGQYRFSGKEFKLTQGSLVFSGKPNEIPVLTLSGQMNLQNLLIEATMNGPLNRPEISFHSTPPLPIGSVISQLLFGQNLSEINALQAAQIVNSIDSLSPQASHILENTRRTLGIDRLRIIATPIGDEGGQTFALQVGKYVTRGILVSVSQGPEGGTTNLSVEVDLNNGLVLQAESEEQPEQGKFTLKWNFNY